MAKQGTERDEHVLSVVVSKEIEQTVVVMIKIVKNIAVTTIAVTKIVIEVSIHEMTNKMEIAVGSKLIFKK
ncbi:MAG: hypothetical protein VX949_10955 [Planctomycetota bacterium]|nr:hypothetical protein [Planctomycetota bacterium]